MKRFMLTAFFVAGFAGMLLSMPCRVEQLKGNVSRTDGAGVKTVLSNGGELIDGDSVSTAGGAYAVLSVPDGSRIRVAEKTDFRIEEASQDSVSVKLSVGKLRSLVSKIAVRKKFEINTPTTVCSVRGTDFEVTVGEKGKTAVHVFEGLVSARQVGGEEIMIHQNQGLSIEENMPPEFIQMSRGGQAAAAKEGLAREVGLDMSREQVLSAAAMEMRNAEYQEGKTVVDVFGKRVRIDEYVLRPSANQFKMVVLNDRDDRFDYFTYKADFNQALPSNLSDATSQMFESAGTVKPGWWVTDYVKARSNTTDVSQDTAHGGNMVQMSNSKWSVYFNNWTLLAGQPGALQTIFGYTRSLSDPADRQNGLTYLPGIASAGYLSGVDSTLTKTADEASYRMQLDVNPGALWYIEDNYFFDDAGNRAKTGNLSYGLNSSGEWKLISGNELNWNNETVITSSLFGGRKIDLVIEPKIMQNTGINQ